MSSTKRRPLQSMLALAIAATAVVTSILVSNTARASSEHDTNPKPTIVLVHGAWADASSWNEVTNRLQRRGFTVIAPANPLRGLASDAAYLSSILATISGPTVLVGHSYGGMVITNAATGNANVKALVYIAAFAPDAGESLGSLGAMNPGSELDPTTLLFRPHPSGLDVYIAPEAFREVFAADVKASTAAVMAARTTSHRCDRAGRTVRRAGVEGNPVVVHGRSSRPRHPTGDRTIHGTTRRGNDHRGRRITRRHDLEAGGRHRPDPRCGSGNH